MTTADRRKVKESGYDRNSHSYFSTSGTFNASHPGNGYVFDEIKEMIPEHPGISEVINRIRDNFHDSQYRYDVVQVAGVPELIVAGYNYPYPQKFLYVI